MKLCSFTNLIKQMFSHSAVMLAIASTALKTSNTETIFSKITFSLHLLTLGNCFRLTSFLSFSKFLGFRKALEQDIMFSSVGVVSRLENSKHLWDLIFLDNNFIRNVFSYANFQRSQKRHCYKLHWDTLFQECFRSRSINSRVGFYRGIRPLGFASWL